MAKDDYYVIAYKILAYLYTQLKAGEAVEENMISHKGTLFQINESYWVYIVENMAQQGYIKGITITKAWGGCIIGDLQNCQITPEGIAYLCENSMLEKAKQFLKDVKDITPFV